MAIHVLMAVIGVSPTYLFFVHTQKRLHRCICAGKRGEKQVSLWGSHAPNSSLSGEGGLSEGGTNGSPLLPEELSLS